jgi:hypothetical protein
MATLRSLLEDHPEWAELPLVVCTSDGNYDWIDGAGSVYEGEWADDAGDPNGPVVPVLVFAPN